MRMLRFVLAVALAAGAGMAASNRAGAQGSPAYQKRCTDAGVPIPPALTATGKDGKPLWMDNGALNNALNFDLVVNRADPGDISSTTTRVLTYTDPTTGGLCIALPRADKTSGKVFALGIICQSKPVGGAGKQTASACFFDNKDIATGKGIVLTLDKYDATQIGKFQGGDQLKENCTQCHRGNNAFQIIPDTPEDVDTGFLMSSTKKDDQTNRYTPIGQPGWVNPPGCGAMFTIGGTKYTFSPPGTGCQRCHSIPRITVGYCQLLIGTGTPPNTVRTGVLDGVYPVGDPQAGSYLMPPGANMRTANETRDIATLKAICTALGYKP